MKRRKIGLIGAGNIGGELASLALSKQLGDVVLFDIPQKESFAKGKALDLEQASAQSGCDASITGSSNWADLAGTDVLIITAGIPRKPGQSRDDLVGTNLPIIRDVADNAKQHCPDAFVIVISNPLDAMVYEFKRRTGAPREKVIGMAGVLDSSRFSLFLAREAGVSIKDVRTMVLGGHGDDMKAFFVRACQLFDGKTPPARHIQPKANEIEERLAQQHAVRACHQEAIQRF